MKEAGFVAVIVVRFSARLQWTHSMMNLFEIRGKLLKNDQAAKSVKMNKEMALTVVSGYGSVGRMVACNTRGLQFKSSHG